MSCALRLFSACSRWPLTVALLAMLLASASAQALPDRGANLLDQRLLDLLTDRRVLCVAAHPDDEDLETLVYLRKCLGVKTHTVFATRGEGGQNEIGKELYTELGVIRSRECREAAALTGSTLSFLNLRDFGFSKSADESFRMWGGQDVVEEALAREIRRFRPHVVITNHDEVSGHGHHQAVGRSLVSVWDRLGQEGAFPGLREEGFEPWQPDALFVRRFIDAQPADVRVPVGDYDTRRGLTYSEIALAALRLHRSQGRWDGERFERHHASGPLVTRYARVKTSREDFGRGLLGGREPPWLPENTPFEYARNQVMQARHVGDRTLVATYLGRAVDLSRMVYEDPDREQEWQLGLLADALATAVGLEIEAEVIDPVATPGEELEVRVRYRHTGGVPITAPVLSVQLRDEDSASIDTARIEGDEDGLLLRGAHGEIVLRGELHADAPPTLPAAEHLYDRHVPQPFGEVVAHFEIASFDTSLSIRTPVHLEVAPPARMLIPATPTLVRPGQATQLAVGVEVNARDGLSGTVRAAGAGLGTNNAEWEWTVEGAPGQSAVLVRTAVAPEPGEGITILPLELELHAQGVEEPLERVTHELVVLDATVEGDPNVGVVYTYDDGLETALDALGVRHSRVTEAEVFAGDLSVYDVLCLDLRAYLERDDVVRANQRLLDYARAGGTLVVLYNKLFEWNPGPTDPGYGPYPLELTHARVTDENAAVTLLAPEHPLLSFPNRLTERDFDGWIQERGLYFPTTYDERYQELLACEDAGEEPLRGGLLHVKLGQGHYVYTSFVWYRQWRIGQPGAYRWLANLVSLPASN